MINFDTDKLIIGLYPQGAGGRFVAHCLSLSNDVLLGDAVCSELQLSDKLNVDDKFNLLTKNIEKTDNLWRDWYLDDVSFWKSFPEDVDYKNIDEYISELSQNNLLERVTHNNDKYFFLLPHYHSAYVKLKDLWKNSKSIVFKNSSLFVLIRNFHRDFSQYLWATMIRKHPNHVKLIASNWRSLPTFILEELKDLDIGKMKQEYYEQFPFESIWSKLKKSNWPEIPPLSILEYISYDKVLRTDIEETFNNFSECYYSELENYPKELINNSNYIWDTNWFFEKELTLYNIRELYNSLDISDYNEKYISKLYDNWLQKNDTITINSRCLKK